MDDDEAGGLFNIDLSSSDESTTNEKERAKEKVPRDFQSEEDFQRVKGEWRPKIEEGELWRKLELPLDQPSKQESQMILHAMEELYFFGRFGEVVQVADGVLRGVLSDDFRQVVVGYRRRCEMKLGKAQGA